MTEFWSNELVLDNSTDLLMLIENKSEPDFAEFDRRLSEVRKAWGKHDSWLEGLATRRRLLEFMQERKPH